MYTQSVHGETIYEYKSLRLFGFNLPHPMGARGVISGFQWFGAKPLSAILEGRVENSSS